MIKNKRENQSVVANIQYGGEYQNQLAEAQDTGICIFCRLNFQKDKDKVLQRCGGWFTRRNDYPTKDVDGQNPDHHFLIISRRHLTSIEEMNVDDLREVTSLRRWLRKEYEIRGGGFITRFDEPLWSGATILHLHFHLIVPRIVEDPENPGKFIARPVYFPIG